MALIWRIEWFSTTITSTLETFAGCGRGVLVPLGVGVGVVWASGSRSRSAKACVVLRAAGALPPHAGQDSRDRDRDEGRTEEGTRPA